MTEFGKLRYDPKYFIGRGRYNPSVFSGLFRESFFGNDKPVAVKRVPTSDISLAELEITKGAANPYILPLIYTELSQDFL